jgi:nitrogen fixation NifU-like protein
MDQNLKREIILENYQNPKNKGLIEGKDYIFQNMDSKSCIDQINLMVKVNDGKVEDIHFDGEACAICTSSTSIMIKEAMNKPVSEVKEIIDNFKNMIDEKEFDSEKLGEAIVYEDIKYQPNRKNCALLAWYGLEKALDKKEK